MKTVNLINVILGIMFLLGVSVLNYVTFVSPSRAQIATPGLPMVALGTCQLTSLSGSMALSSCSGGIPTGANAVVLRAEAQALRYRSDAGAAASSAGVPILVADPPVFYQGALSSLRFIESTSGGKLNVLFYRAPGAP